MSSVGRLLAIGAALLIPLNGAFAAKLGGAYFIDDSDIGAVGSCEFENWASFAANGDRVLVVSPACVANLGRPVELGFNYVRSRTRGEWDNLLAFTAKTTLIEPKVGQWGVAVAGAVTTDPARPAVNGFVVNAPFTYEFSKAVRLNVNFGAQYDGDAQRLYGTGGIGASWTFREKWSVSGEAYAVLGQRQASPRLQTGIRYNPTKDIDCDLILGRNLTGEGSNWVTLALTIRINDK